MARTESVSYTVHPSEEQSAIQTMEVFGWRLLSTQEIHNTTVNHKVEFGDLYEVTTTTRYIKLAFSRDLDEPNLDILKGFEQQYHALQYKPKPFQIDAGMWVLAVLLSLCFVGVPLLIALIVQFALVTPSTSKWKTECAEIARQKRAVLEEARKY